jgi:hypothetical protein
MTTRNTETVTWEIHVQMPDGKEGPAAFLDKPEVYDDLERAAYWVDRYTSEQVGWKKPIEERKRYFLVEVTTNTTVDTKVPTSIALNGERFQVEQSTVVRVRVREGVSWYAEDGTVIEREPIEPGTEPVGPETPEADG